MSTAAPLGTGPVDPAAAAAVMFRLGLVMLHERFIQTIIGTVFVHISYFLHARCVVSCVVSCVTLRPSAMFCGVLILVSA
jgi:hypothetical protein